MLSGVILDSEVRTERINCMLLLIVVIVILHGLWTCFESKHHRHKCKPPMMMTTKGTLYLEYEILFPRF